MRQKANQIIINRYEPGEGIAAHRDHIRYFTGDTLEDSSKFYDVLLPIGSLAVMKDHARNLWTHEIIGRKSDKINDITTKRDTRISITFRTVADEFQEH